MRFGSRRLDSVNRSGPLVASAGGPRPDSTSMSIVAISPARLAKVSRSSASLGRALERWLFELDQPPLIELGGVGPVRVRCDGIDSTAPTPAREELALFGRDGRRARIAIDLRLALALVSGALGSKQALAIRGLGVAERGVLAGQVASVLAWLLSSPSAPFVGQPAVDVAGGAAPVAEPFASVGFSVEACG